MKAVVIVALCALSCHADLPHGEHAVSYHQWWAFDAARTYSTSFDDSYDGERRPMLIQLWHPTTDGGEYMPYGAYFNAAAGEIEATDALARSLGAYARDISVTEVFGAPEAELDETAQAKLEAFLAAPTRSIRDARSAAGVYPVIVYHSGAGSSFEDNAEFCEYLASHGYVVLGGAYQRGDGRSLGVDGGDASVEDMRELIRLATRLPFADVSRLGLAGHSLGAQAVLLFAAEPTCPADAVVLLDTTQDYYGLDMPLHASLVEAVLEGAASMRAPILAMADPTAIFELLDRLTACERTLLTCPELDHNEYIAQGQDRLEQLGDDRAEAAWAEYEAVCEYALLFFDAMLKDAPARFEQATEAYASGTLGEGLHAVRMPPGVDGPAPHDAAAGTAPTPRQLRQLVVEGRINEACDAIEKHPDAVIGDATMLASTLLLELVETGRIDDARRLNEALTDCRLNAGKSLFLLGRMYRLMGKPYAADLFEAVLVLEPDHEGAAAALAGPGG